MVSCLLSPFAQHPPTPVASLVSHAPSGAPFAAVGSNPRFPWQEHPISFSAVFFFPALLLIVHHLHHQCHHDHMREVHFLQSVKLLWDLVFLLVMGYNEVFGRCNGAVGKVVVADIVYDENCPLPRLPKCVLTGRLWGCLHGWSNESSLFKNNISRFSYWS